jgi:hypothetical protein
MKRSNEFFKTTTLKQALRMGPRKFVKDYLFPAMRREHGNGFAMSCWMSPIVGCAYLDEVVRPAPACGTAMCIGGTMQAILGVENGNTLAKVLGLRQEAEDSTSTASRLFYAWRQNFGPWEGLSQPFADAKTPREKERIAEKAVLAAIKIGEQE